MCLLNEISHLPTLERKLLYERSLFTSKVIIKHSLTKDKVNKTVIAVISKRKQQVYVLLLSIL